MNLVSFIVNNFNIEGKLNRTEYLGLLLSGLLIYPFLCLFIIIILTFFKLFDKNIMSNGVIIVISIIWLINLIIIGYKRYKDIFKEFNLFIIYVISLFLIFYGWKFIGFFGFLGIIPIIILIFIPGKKSNNFKIDNNLYIEKKSFIEQIKFYKNYNYNFKQLLTLRTFIITTIFFIIFSLFLDDLIYNYSYYGTHPIKIESDENLKDNSYVQIDIKSLGLNKQDLYKEKESITKNRIITIKDNQIQKSDNTRKDKIIIKNEKFKYLSIYKVDIFDYDIIENEKSILLNGRISKIKKGFNFELGKIPTNNGKNQFFLIIFILSLYCIIIFKDISTIKNKKVSENLREIYEGYSYSKLLESIKNNINTDYSLNLLFNELMNDSLKLYNNKTYSFEKSILDDLTNSNENDIQIGLKIKESIKNIKENEIEKYFEKEIIYITLELGYIINYNDLYNNENNLVINELEELIKKEKNGIKIIKKLQRESKYIYNIILKELLGKDFKLLDEYGKVNTVVRFHFYNVFLNSIIFHRLLKEEQDFFSIFFHILNPIGFLVSKIIKFFRGY